MQTIWRNKTARLQSNWYRIYISILFFYLQKMYFQSDLASLLRLLYTCFTQLSQSECSSCLQTENVTNFLFAKSLKVFFFVFFHFPLSFFTLNTFSMCYSVASQNNIFPIPSIQFLIYLHGEWVNVCGEEDEKQQARWKGWSHASVRKKMGCFRRMEMVENKKEINFYSVIRLTALTL